MDTIQQQLSDLQTQYNELKQLVDSIFRSDSIPRDVENAFRERLSTSTNVTTTGVTGTANTQDITVTSTPQTFTVPAQPSKTITLVIDGITYNVLCK